MSCKISFTYCVGRLHNSDCVILYRIENLLNIRREGGIQFLLAIPFQVALILAVVLVRALGVINQVAKPLEEISGRVVIV